MVPKVYSKSNIYKNNIKIADSGEQCFFKMVPRIDAFEISVNGYVSYAFFWKFSMFL